MRREPQAKSAASRRIVAAKARSTTRKPARAQQPEPDEYPLAHDAATWDEEASDSSWDDDEARITGELAPSDDD